MDKIDGWNGSIDKRDGWNGSMGWINGMMDGWNGSTKCIDGMIGRDLNVWIEFMGWMSKWMSR